MVKSQSGLIQYLLLFILLAGIGIAVYLTQYTQIFKPRADSASTCKAYNPQTFKDCLYRAQDANDNLTQIEITSQIVCQTKEECTSIGSGGGFILTQRSGPLTIFGTPGTAAGFKRVGNYDYALLMIGGGSSEIRGITLKDLIFDETTAECDFVTEGTGKCNSPLVLGPRIGDSTVDHVTILHAKNHGMQVATARNLVIKNSIFYDAGGDGLWFNSAYAASCPAILDFYTFQPCDVDMNTVNNTITIQNNLFADNAVSGLEFYSYTANPDYPNKITDNLFVHNHRNAKYIHCPNPLPNPQPANESQIQRRGGHCPGGQLAIARSKSVIVEKNTIRDAIIDTIKPVDRYEPQPGVSGKTYDQLGLKNPGIELSETLSDIKIQNNKIINNRLALFADYIGPRFRTNGVNIIWNVVYGNELGNFLVNGESEASLRAGFGDNGYFKGGYSFDRNITDPNYNLPLPRAFIFADPPVCDPQAGSTCNTKIKWYSQDQTNLNIRIKDDTTTNLGTTNDGSVDVPWLSTNGGVFEIRSGNTVLASTFSTRFNPNPASPSPSVSQPSTSPSPSLAPSPSASASPSTPSSPSPIPSAANMSASPNPCQITSGETCTSTITWNFPAGADVRITIKENPGSLFATGYRGSQTATWIRATGATFQAYVNGNLSQELFVKGTGPKLGDLNNDGLVDALDYGIFVQDYVSNNLRSDLNRNGSLDIFDFNILYANFGR